MKILSIETSCDETGVAVVEAVGDFPHAHYNVLGNGLASQIEIHREFGGVFPAVAKREHAKALVPMLMRALEEAGMLVEGGTIASEEQRTERAAFLEREPGLAEALDTFVAAHAKPDIDMIAVTAGPGLEPALWVGVNFTRALAALWDVPLVPVNHMEGHILASCVHEGVLAPFTFPALALLISGGHTELLHMRGFGQYEVIGRTRDDAVGEAFDKAARMMGLPYPGGPEISRLAREARERGIALAKPLPRPMLHSNDYDFSFSGLKTAVRTRVLDAMPSEEEKLALARDFEECVTEVLLAKSIRAITEIGARMLIVGGGVTANTYLREMFTNRIAEEHPECSLLLPPRELSTDNAIMIALTGHMHAMEAKRATDSVRADGSLELAGENL